MRKSAEAFRTISEVSAELDVPKHVLRFWEVKFPQLRPMKRGGGRRYYRPEDIELLSGIRALLHSDGFTIKGVQKILKEQGVEYAKLYGRGEVADGLPVPAANADTSNNAKIKKISASTKGRPRKKAAQKSELHDTILTVIGELEMCRDNLKKTLAKPNF
ncbi:MAG: MerR family transcriptional regulator [Pseudomonadota bacterium]